VKLIFSDHAWDDYIYWQTTDKKILRRINTLIKETKLNPFEGIGKASLAQRVGNDREKPPETAPDARTDCKTPVPRTKKAL